MHGPKEIIAEAGALPVEERVRIIDSLLRTLNPPDSDIDRAWAKEAKRRLQELKSGKARAVPGTEVFASLRKRLGK